MRKMDVPVKEPRADLSFFLLVLAQPLGEWVVPTHIDESQLLHSVCGFKCSSLQDTASQTPRNDVLPALWPPLGQSS